MDDMGNWYVVSYREKSEGTRCNNEYIKVVESEIFPTEELLRKNNLINDGFCRSISCFECENCASSYIADFKVERCSFDRLKELGLPEVIKLK